MSKFARSYERGEQTGILRSCLDVTLVSLRAKIYLLMNQIVAATESEEALFEGLSLKNQVRFPFQCSANYYCTCELYEFG